MYNVTNWNTGEVLYSFEKLAVAKRWARGLGHTGEDVEIFTSYPPVAFVANEKGECVYNPRFGKNIASSVSQVINSNDDCLRS